MGDGRIEVVSIVDRVYESVRSRILDGTLERGARLRQEALAAELGVSRTPLREALRRLASEGLVELEPNRGARIPDLSHADMVIAYEARLALEPGAARLAAANPDPVALERMRTAIARHRRAATQHALFDANRAFHLALVDAARNEHLSRLAANLWAAGIGAVILAVQDETPAEIAADADAHERIAAAVAAGDGDRAERLVREHVGGALATFRSTA
jgi:DNA-binding GntR family transcriptional regulator